MARVCGVVSQNENRHIARGIISEDGRSVYLCAGTFIYSDSPNAYKHIFAEWTFAPYPSYKAAMKALKG